MQQQDLNYMQSTYSSQAISGMGQSTLGSSIDDGQCIHMLKRQSMLAFFSGYLIVAAI
jgi:hypothetical protein